MHAEMSAAGQAPLSREAQMRYIIGHVDNLRHEMKCAILTLVMMEVGDRTADGRPVVLGNGRGVKAVNIDLDAVNSVNPDLVGQIYNMVHARIVALSTPAKGGAAC